MINLLNLLINKAAGSKHQHAPTAVEDGKLTNPSQCLVMMNCMSCASRHTK